MKRSVAIWLPFLAVSVLSGCYYDHEQILYKTPVCESTTTPTYAAVIVPLLNANCNACHSGAYASAGVRLDSYSYVMTYVNNGKLTGTINQGPGFIPMPLNASKLSDCNINKIQTWITAGAVNN